MINLKLIRENPDILKKLFSNTFQNEKIIALIEYRNDCLCEIDKLAKSKVKNNI